MANADLERFRIRVREYRLLVNRNQSDLAAYLNLDYTELSNRLNLHKNARLTHDNVRTIVRALAEWDAITTRSQAEELLDLMLCPRYDIVDLQARPLSKLVASPGLTTELIANPAQNLITTPIISLHSGPQSPPFKLYRPNEPLLRHNLPQQLPSFIGRQKEIAELKKRLGPDKGRLLTLVGVGGCGKTRLSLQVATELLENFRDGVWFIELASLSDPEFIPQTIATALGLSEQAGKSILATLMDYLRSRQLLLVLDNCEHLIEACARLINTLLQTAPQLQILASSRETFGINGEITFRVPSLALPESQELPPLEALRMYDAVEIFRERAEAVNPAFALTSQNAATVVKVCRQLDGLPLAIELATARLKVLTVEQIAARLDDRLSFLTRGSRTVLPRQQTLRALIDWSFDLLSPAEKRLLASLSVFAGGWNLDAAEAVCGESSVEGVTGHEQYEVLDALMGLVNKSLLQLDEVKDGSEARYFFLETIRQYGLEKLQAAGEQASVRERHFSYFSKLAKELGLKFDGHEQKVALKLMDKDLDNMRAAINYGLKLGQFEAVYRMIENLYWDTRGYWTEVRRYYAQVLALPGNGGVIRGLALSDAGFIAMRQGDSRAARTYYEEALAISGEHDNKMLLTLALHGQGSLHMDQGNYEEARRYTEESVAAAKGLNDFYMAAAQGNLGIVLMEQGEYEESRRLLEEAVKIGRKIGHVWLVSLNLNCLGLMALILEDYVEAHRCLEEALSISEEIGFQLGKLNSLIYLGMTYTSENKFKEARLTLETGLVMGLKAGGRFGSPFELVGAANLLSKVWLQNRQANLPLQIACLCGAIAGVQAARNKKLGQSLQTFYEQALEIARSSLDDPTFQEAFARGRAMSLEEAIAFSLQVLAGV